MTPNRCWIEVSLGALARNYHLLKDRASGSELVCVVKADAYHHGAARVACRLQQEGAVWFAVANAAEGAALRHAGIRGELLVLGEVLDFEYETLFEERLIPVVHDTTRLPELDRQAESRGTTWPFHLKVDSGMGRLGSKAPAPVLAAAIQAAPHLRLDGLMSHLATTAQDLTPQSLRQLEAFDRLSAELASLSIVPRWRHLAASLPVIHGQSALFGTMVRPGLGLYGYPCDQLEPVLSWKARVVMVKDVAPGEPVGYGARWHAQRPSRIAVLACGYADGVPHRIGEEAGVLLHGCRAPIRGAVSMDLISVDVTDCPQVSPGDAAVLIGRDGDHSLTAQDWASWSGTIPYVILCSITSRVARAYIP